MKIGIRDIKEMKNQEMSKFLLEVVGKRWGNDLDYAVKITENDFILVVGHAECLFKDVIYIFYLSNSHFSKKYLHHAVVVASVDFKIDDDGEIQVEILCREEDDAHPRSIGHLIWKRW